jgi:hypothetical protein
MHPNAASAGTSDDANPGVGVGAAQETTPDSVVAGARNFSERRIHLAYLRRSRRVDGGQADGELLEVAGLAAAGRASPKKARRISNNP